MRPVRRGAPARKTRDPWRAPEPQKPVPKARAAIAVERPAQSPFERRTGCCAAMTSARDESTRTTLLSGTSRTGGVPKQAVSRKVKKKQSNSPKARKKVAKRSKTVTVFIFIVI
jgi:hypothetical protein